MQAKEGEQTEELVSEKAQEKADKREAGVFAEAKQEERTSEEVMDKMENDLKREAMIRDILEEFLA